MAINMARTAGFDGALSHFREVIIGSLSIGLKSIKKLQDIPPESIASQTKSSLSFIGIAGEKFLRKSLETGDFFRQNKIPHNVRLMLMDPFSDDIVRLSTSKKQQEEYRKKIISSIIDLAALEAAGFRFDVRLYPKVPPLRLMIADGAIAALSVYSSDTNGWKNAQLIFDTRDCPDSLAPYFLELFDDLWERGLNINLRLRAEALKGLLLPGNVIKTSVEYGMVHGRFQPFHHEHLEYVLHGITHCTKKCLIGITQPNIRAISECDILPHRGKPEGNPFSFDERADMIRISLEDLGIEKERYIIIPFDVDHAEESIPALFKHITEPIELGDLCQFVKVFTSWELHKIEAFYRNGLRVEVIRGEGNQVSPKNVTGTLVRELMSSNRNWRDFVPTGTKRVVAAQSSKRGNA
ncbi:MAG: hypothetical protein Q8L80_09020 [Gallionella sp.]|nr:hypothetical protein [Gallionella sp.]